MTLNKRRVTVTLDQDVLMLIDHRRRRETRSSWLNRLLKRVLNGD